MGVMVMDTATDALGVGIGATDGTLYTGVVQRVLRGHSRLLQPTLQFALQSSGQEVVNLQQLGVGIGPGSYTGVRMAVATAKAMAHTLGVPLTTIPTLDAIALAAGHTCIAAPRRVLVLLFARRQRAFGAWFSLDKGMLVAREDATVREVASWLATIPANVIAGRAPVCVHDFPAAQMGQLDGMPDGVDVIEWRYASGGLPQALLRLTVTGSYPFFTGERLHDVAPEYALPVEAEAKLQEELERGGRA
jgi:tRNA threonylcarbamoyladenosine biosynthesis protein TsaB